ncbi:MAG TPA: hypothetical protein DEG10_02810 [Leclercia adecarboxylata]|nr:hypothetical protein [Leclercia adecarboxylata]
MSDSLSNKELVAVGHQFAKAMSSDTPIMDIAKIVSRLAERLDCTTLALREMTKQRDELAAENAGLKQNTPDLQTMMSALDAFFADEEVPERAMIGAYNILRGAVPTPATDAYLAEVRAQGVERFLSFCGEENSVFIEKKAYYRSLADAVDEFAAKLRQEGAQ